MRATIREDLSMSMVRPALTTLSTAALHHVGMQCFPTGLPSFQPSLPSAPCISLQAATSSELPAYAQVDELAADITRAVEFLDTHCEYSIRLQRCLIEAAGGLTALFVLQTCSQRARCASCAGLSLSCGVA